MISPATRERAEHNAVGLIDNDVELCETSDYILSIVPPRDAIATAQRIADAALKITTKRTQPLHYLDLNAISPRTARQVHEILKPCDVRFIDGGIIGGPPSQQADGTWSKPSIPTSGPVKLSATHAAGKQLADVLNVRHVSDEIGSASGLKMCFAATSKGFTALAIQSFTAAHRLGVTDELRDHLDEYSPGVRARAEKGVTAMPPKAYRWVNEMEQIAETFEAEGGFAENESPFRAIARVYDLVANGTDLGQEITGKRKRGSTVEDVAELMLEGARKRKPRE